MFLIGLTGNIASGKSTIAAMIGERGARVIDADELSHAVLLRGRPAWHGVIRTFGASVLRANAQIDRRQLGARVFGDPEKLRALEAIVHPAVRTELALALRDTHESVVVVEAVKLVEGGLHQLCDALWVVLCDPDEAKRRLIENRRLTSEQADARLASQPPLGQKLAEADVVIDNSGSLIESRAQVATAWDQIPFMPIKDKAEIFAQLLQIPLPASPAHSAPSAPRDESPPAVSAPPRSIPLPTRPMETIAPPIVEPTAPAPSTPIAEPILPSPPRPAEPLPLPPTAEAGIPAGANVLVHRARRADLNTLSRLLAKQEGRSEPLRRVETMQRLGRWGYWLVYVNDQARGFLSWRAENLVGVIRECWFERASDSESLLPPLLAGVEQEARSLVNEVLILVLDPHTVNSLAPIAAAVGYSAQKLDDLHKIWREVAEEHLDENDELYVKHLREELITKPI